MEDVRRIQLEVHTHVQETIATTRKIADEHFEEIHKTIAEIERDTHEIADRAADEARNATRKHLEDHAREYPPHGQQ